MYPFVCWLRPIFPVRLQTSIFGTAKLNFRVRNGNGWTLCVRITNSLRLTRSFCVSVDLFFRSVSRQVFSALQSLTSVFGMGTGGPFALKTLTSRKHVMLTENRTKTIDELERKLKKFFELLVQALGLLVSVS